MTNYSADHERLVDDARLGGNQVPSSMRTLVGSTFWFWFQRADPRRRLFRSEIAGYGWCSVVDDRNRRLGWTWYDRRFLTEASMVCQGAPAAVARCIVETMLNEFGADLFDAESLILTPDQQSRIEPIQFACLLAEA